WRSGRGRSRSAWSAMCLTTAVANVDAVAVRAGGRMNTRSGVQMDVRFDPMGDRVQANGAVMTVRPALAPGSARENREQERGLKGQPHVPGRRRGRNRRCASGSNIGMSRYSRMED